MDSGNLRICMLGNFSIQLGDQEINDGDNRSRKVWLLLAYMLYYRKRTIPIEELINLLWGEAESSSNPLNALKTMFHRVRAELNKLEPDIGHTLIIRREGSYAWNPAVSFRLDVEEFDRLLSAAEETEDEGMQLQLLLDALALYQGDFLYRLSSNSWVIPILADYHNQYLESILRAVSLLENQDRHQEAVALCRRGIQIDAYHEPLYQHLMQNLMELGQQREAITAYDEMSKLLFENRRLMPSDKSLAIYREAMKTTNSSAISLITVQEQLRTTDPSDGALFCDYDFFKAIYQAEARSLARSGNSAHIVLLSVTGGVRELPPRSMDCCMDNLKELLCSNLRRGDIASRCSISQYLLLLPQANYENSCRVCERIMKAFTRQYPHSPAKLHFSVQALEPMN